MQPERWQQIDQLFHLALEKERDERELFLAEVCAGDEVLRNDIEELIASHEQAEDFIESPASDLAAGWFARGQSGLKPGEKIGPYEVQSLLGIGGMGEVYLAIDTRLSRQVALKLLPPRFTSDPERIRRFEQEVRAASALNHPNFVTIHEIGHVNNTQFMVTEFVQGQTLRQLMNEKPFTLNEALNVAIQVASALAGAHSAGIVHRDIKPENIMLRADGYVKILDFGLAKLTETQTLDSDPETPTLLQSSPGLVMGTVQYMSPEQARGKKVDVRTDIWSLGVVLYELLACRVPFSGETPSHVMVSLMEDELPGLTSFANVPAELDRIVTRTLSKNKKERYQTARELALDLKELKRDLQLQGRSKQSVETDEHLRERATKSNEEIVSSDALASTGTAGIAANKAALIGTVKRRSHRLFADRQPVEARDGRLEKTIETAANHELVPGPPLVKNWLSNYLYLMLGLILVVVLLVFTVFLNSWFTRSKSLQADAPVLYASFSSEKLSTDGKVVHAVISPDGKKVVYTNGIRGKESVWLRQLESANNIEIIPASDVVYGRLAFSPDGNSLYFHRRTRNEEGGAAIYRVPIFGGVPTKIVNEVHSPFSISPDGGKISFVRNDLEDKSYGLWIADTDGRNERKLVSRPGPLRIGSNQISPDGKTVAFAVGHSDNAANEFGLAEVNIENGAQRELTKQKFFNIHTLVWLPNQSGLLIAASRIPTRNFLLWQVSVATGDASPLTKDSESYSELSLDKAAGVIVATQTKADFKLLLYRINLPLYKKGNLSDKRILADARTAGFTPNGKIIFSSAMSGNAEIWSINADGSEQKQLTNDPADDAKPVSSPDNHFIFFVSNRTGEAQVWRMNADGSNQTQITFKEGGSPIFVSPDGRWVYYLHALQSMLWRVSTNGGEGQLVFNKERPRFAFSPDGSQVAFSERRVGETSIVIVSLADGRIIKTFVYADKFADREEGLLIGWLPDGKSLVYVLADNEFDNYILWLQPLDAKTPQKIADLGEEGITSLAVSPDGKSLAVVQGRWKADAVLIKGLR